MADQDFHIIDTRHEQAAVHMADAWARITEQPGVCMYTTPGFANAIPGLTNAMHSESPVISIAGCADLHDLGRGGQQEIDQVHMAAPMAKGSFLVDDARRIPEFIRRAMRLWRTRVGFALLVPVLGFSPTCFLFLAAQLRVLHRTSA